MDKQTTRQKVYNADELVVQRKNQSATAEKVSYGTNVEGM